MLIYARVTIKGQWSLSKVAILNYVKLNYLNICIEIYQTKYTFTLINYHESQIKYLTKIGLDTNNMNIHSLNIVIYHCLSRPFLNCKQIVTFFKFVKYMYNP